MDAQLDHTAIVSHDIAASVAWYVELFNAEVLYADDTWAFLKLGQGKLALVTAGEHPAHVAVRVSAEALEEAARVEGKTVDEHRDGTKSIYMGDPDGNPIELICYPVDETSQ